MRDTDEITLIDMLERGARWRADTEAVVDGAYRLTYAELRDLVGRCAGLLDGLGVRKGDRVALLMHPSAMHVVAMFGVIELGAVPVALHVRESERTLAAVLARLEPTALVYDESLAPQAALLAEGSKRPLVLVGARSGLPAARDASARPMAILPDDLGRHEPLAAPPALRGEDAALIVLSSGTTSLPKGIVHTHRSLTALARGAQYMWQGIAPSDRVVNSASVSFVGWAAQSLPFLNVGATNVFLSAWDARGYLELLQRERITHAFLVPTPWRMLLEEDVESYDISSLRKVGSAGEPLDESTLHAIRERVCAWIVNAYGSTESGTMAGTCLWGDEMNGELISCVGRPMMGADLRIVSVGGSPADEVPLGEVGEVLLTGPTLAREVYGDPERTAASFLFDGRRRWWRSKDLGRLDGCGRLFLEGRVDDMIISGGINVFPVLIENVLMSHERVRACAVVGAPDERWGQRICAFIVADGELDAEELRKLVSSSELAGYQRPREYVFVEELPSTATNKLNRRLLREHAAAGDRA